MTKIEQINWAKQILGQTPGTPQNEAETSLRLSGEIRKLTRKNENLTLERDNARARLRQYQHKLAESEEQNEILEERDRVLASKLRREMDDNCLLRIEKLKLAKQLEELKEEMARPFCNVATVDERVDALNKMVRDYGVKLYEKGCENRRLKLRVNELIRKGKVAA